MKITFARPAAHKGGSLVLPVFADRALSEAARAVDEASGGHLTRAMAATPRFTGKRDEIMSLPLVPGCDAARVVLVGLGAVDGVDVPLLQRIGGILVAHLNAARETEAAVRLGGAVGAVAADVAAAELAFGAKLRSWRFDRY